MTTKIKNYYHMKLTFQKLIIPFVVILMLASCQSKNKRPENLAPDAKMVKALEVIQTPNYTYVRASEDDKEYWLAINAADIVVGETYFWSKGMEMKEFTSKELKRTFRNIYFIDDFSKDVITAGAKPAPKTMGGRQMAPEKAGIKVDRAPGGITIAELYAKRDQYSGKRVILRGEVVKFARDIMKINWAHIQDGTKNGADYDLTVTTHDSVTVGNVVTFEGTVILKKDFGYGYFYEVLLEDAKLKLPL